MIKSKNMRQVLWYGGIVLFLAGVAMFRSQTPVIGWPCLALAVAAVVLVFHKLTILHAISAAAQKHEDHVGQEE